MDWLVCILHLETDAAATCAIAGLIWFVQVVDYPLFADVQSPDIRGYAARHVHRDGDRGRPLTLIERETAALRAVWSTSEATARLRYLGLPCLL
tara:strand:- start:1278 stop:1559 length:282 start_codon:yes stop_codon:yes gene_type:complete